MTDLPRLDPTGRFTGLADLYARCRPGYPDAAIDYVVRRCGLGQTTLRLSNREIRLCPAVHSALEPAVIGRW